MMSCTAARSRTACMSSARGVSHLAVQLLPVVTASRRANFLRALLSRRSGKVQLQAICCLVTRLTSSFHGPVPCLERGLAAQASFPAQSAIIKSFSPDMAVCPIVPEPPETDCGANHPPPPLSSTPALWRKRYPAASEICALAPPSSFCAGLGPLAASSAASACSSRCFFSAEVMHCMFAPARRVRGAAGEQRGEVGLFTHPAC